jgi:hypothetical protein
VYAATSETAYYWDKATGILVGVTTQFPEYIMNIIAIKTSMVQPQIFRLNPVTFYALVIGAVTAIIAVITLFMLCRKK